MEYTVDYFIKKFEAIPANLWCVFSLTKEEDVIQHCALGHCGVECSELMYVHNKESDALTFLFYTHLRQSVIFINDGHEIVIGSESPQFTPKERILAALYKIKAKIEEEQSSEQAVKQVNSIINEKVLEEVL